MHRPGMHVDKCCPQSKMLAPLENPGLHCIPTFLNVGLGQHVRTSSDMVMKQPFLLTSAQEYMWKVAPTPFSRGHFRVVLVGAYWNCISFLASLPALMPFFIKNNNKTLTISLTNYSKTK